MNKFHKPVSMRTLHLLSGTTKFIVMCSCGWESDPCNDDEQMALVMSGHIFLRSISRPEKS